MKVLVANSDALDKIAKEVKMEFSATPIVVKDDDSWVPRSFISTSTEEFVPDEHERYAIVMNGMTEAQTTSLVKSLQSKGIAYDTYRFSRRKGFVRA